MFNVLLQVSWKFNFSIKTITNMLELNYRVVQTELEHSMQSHMFCIFVYRLQVHAKCFRILTLYMNNLELDNNLPQQEIRQTLIRIWVFFLSFFFRFNTFSVVFSSLRKNRETLFVRNLFKVPNIIGTV